MDYENNHIKDLLRLGDRIRSLREQKGYSQEKLSSIAGLHRNFISSLELAQKKPTYTTLIKLARAFNIRLIELLPDDNNNDIEDKK